MVDTPMLLNMRRISKSFAGNQVLHDIDIDLTAGEVHAVVGHNGAGKSTLIKVLAGMYDDYRGEIQIGGAAVRFNAPAASLAAGVAVIQQEFALVPFFTVAENIALGHEPAQNGLIDRAVLRRQAQDLLQELGFEIPLDVPVSKLSVALQQLTEVAKALSRRARILVMDEPTARLAPAERGTLFGAMKKLKQRGVGIIYISHFLEEVLAKCDRVTILRDGHRIATGVARDFDASSLTAHIIGESAPDKDRISSVLRPAIGKPVLELRNFGATGRPSSTLSIHAGEIVALAGLIGSGRTTLAEAICGARQNNGELRLDGHALRLGSVAAAAERGIVLVPEDRKYRGLVMASSVGSNIVLAALKRMYSHAGIVNAETRRQAIDRSVRKFSIQVADVDMPISALSGGNQQKVLLARAGLSRPKVLVLDQPTAGVDVGAKHEIYNQIRALAGEGVACLVVSDELEEILGLCDRVAIVRGSAVANVITVAGLTQHELLMHMS